MDVLRQLLCSGLLRGWLARRTLLLRLLVRSLALFWRVLLGCGSGFAVLFLALAAFLGHSGGILTVAARTLDHAALSALELGQRVLGTVVELHLAGAAQHLRGNHLAAAFRRINDAALTRRDLLQFGIRLVLIFQAAHQTAAHTGDLRRIERQVLILRHVDGNRMEILEVRTAAQFTAAAAQTANHLRLIAHADLAQLNAGAEHACEVLDQLAEVHTAVCGEVKQQFVHVKGAFRGDKVHFQTAILDLLLADDKRLIGALFIALERFHVGFGCHTNHALERLHDLLIGHIGVALHTVAVFNTAGRLNNYTRAGCNFQTLRVEIIHFSVRFETDSNYRCQKSFPPVW